MRTSLATLAALLFAVSGVLAAGAATSGLGKPPHQCGDYEYLKNSTCIVQSHAMTFTIAPKQVAPGGIVTATTTVLFDSPGNGAAAVSWSWNSVGIGKRLPGCGPEKGSKPLVSKCRFKVGSPTGGWQTVTLHFSTFVGPAQSRDYYAVVDKKKPKPKPKPVKKGQTPKKEEPYKCVAPPGKNTVTLKGFGGDPRMIIVRRRGAVTTTEKGSVQPVNVMTNRYATAGTVVKTGPNSVVKIGALNGSSVLVGPGTTVRLTNRGFVILELPKNPGFTVTNNGQTYKVRTCSVISAARG